MAFWAALQFLTIVPGPLRRAMGPRHMEGALAFFPVVGLLLGLFWLGADEALSRVLPLPVVNVLLVGVMVVVTGGLHLDGFIDTCDAAVPRRSAQERLAIMADSRVGAFGVAGGCLVLLLKFAALSSVPGNLRLEALVLAPVLGRWGMTYAIFAYPYARGESGKGYAFKLGATRGRFLVVSLATLAIAGIIGWGWRGFAVMAVSWAGVAALAGYVRSRLGGLTGDSYGAVNEAAEVLALLAVPVLWRTL